MQRADGRSGAWLLQESSGAFSGRLYEDVSRPESQEGVQLEQACVSLLNLKNINLKMNFEVMFLMSAIFLATKRVRHVKVNR